MFSKKCPRCNRKKEKDFDFCPYCGLDYRGEKRASKERDFGLLGQDDNFSQMPAMNMKMPFGMDGLFNSLLKEVDKQFRELDREMTKEKPVERKKDVNSISISISTATGKKPEIKIMTSGPEFQSMGKEIKEMKIKNNLSDEDAKKLAKLPKREAETQVRRLSNKIIYELDLPGVKELKDIIVNKLENSVEVKAFSKDRAYFKLIPVNLPITDYKLKDSKLVIEFSAR